MNMRNHYPDDYNFNDDPRDMLHDKFNLSGNDLENLLQDYLEDPYDCPVSERSFKRTKSRQPFNRIPLKKKTVKSSTDNSLVRSCYDVDNSHE